SFVHSTGTRFLPSRLSRERFDHFAAARLVQDETFERAELAAPWRLLDRIHSMAVAGFAPLTDSVGAEVDVLGMVFILEGWGKQSHYVHRRRAAIALNFRHGFVLRLALGDQGPEFCNDMAHAVQ